MIPDGTAPPITVTHLDGVRFSIRIRTHEIVVDQTVRGGGLDSAPTPLELLGASLGSCIAYYVDQFLWARGFTGNGVRVDVVPTKGSRPSRIEHFAVRLILPPSVPEHYLPMIERVVHTCPAHNTLTMGASIDVQIGLAERALAAV